jgi:hypothetical protein
MKNVLLAVLWMQLNLIAGVISTRNIRIPKKLSSLPGKQSVQLLRSTQKKISRNETASLRLRRPKQIKQKDISKYILSKLSENGSKVTKCPGEALYLVENMRFGDAAWNIFEHFAESAPNSPLISILYSLAPDVYNTSMAPPDSLMPAIVGEASSIRSHYAKLDVSAFAGGAVPAIPKPAAFPMLQLFNTTKLALSKLCERIQNPNHPDYPVLAALPPGSYMCTVTYHWTNAALLVAVHKPICK